MYTNLAINIHRKVHMLSPVMTFTSVPYVIQKKIVMVDGLNAQSEFYSSFISSLEKIM